MQKNFDTAEKTERSLTREEIFDVALESLRREEPVVLSPMERGVSFFCMLSEVDPNWMTLRNPVPPEIIHSVLSAESFGLFCKAYWLQTDKLTPHGTFLRFALPETAVLGNARNAERVYFSPRDNAVVEIQHPFDPGTILRRRVFDLSEGGLSFRARIHTPFIQPGRLLPSCQVFIQGHAKVRHKGRVVYVKRIIDLGGQSYFQVGVQFSTLDEEV